MAKVSFSGMDELQLSMAQLAEIPEDVKDEMLSSAADIGIRAIREHAPVGVTQQLLNSIGKIRKKDKNGDLYYVVYPQGTRDDGVRNAEVGFILEFGAPHRGIDSRQWMQHAVDDCADQCANAAYTVYDKWLKSKNL